MKARWTRFVGVWALLLLLAAPVVCEEPFTSQNESLGPLSLGMQSTLARRILGSPEVSGQVVLEAATGLYVQEWRYPDKGLQLTFGSEEQSAPATLQRIQAGAPCDLRTSRNIGLGDSAADIKKAYHGLLDDSCSEELLVVGTIYDGVMFTIKEGRVVEIFIGAGAE